MFIYLTTNTVNDKKYVGLCARSSDQTQYLGSGKLLRQAIKKHGRGSFVRETLETCDTEEELRLCEQKWISHFDAVNNPQFYNLHEGGRGGNVSQFVDRETLSISVKKSWDNYTEEEKLKRCHSAQGFGDWDKTGVNNPMHGRSAISEQNLKWYCSPEKTIYVPEGTQPEGYVRGRKWKLS
jgi:hypothetical protein